MTILTMGPSPYLLTRNGRINSALLRGIKQEGHKVGGIVWEHDVRYFLPNETGVHSYDHNGESICRLFPFIKHKGELGTFTVDVLKSTQPNVVVSIGDYADITFLSAIKSRYRGLFKWIAIIPFGGETINELYRYDLEYADTIICTNERSGNYLRSIVQAPIEVIPFGPDCEVFHPSPHSREFGVVYNCKNDQTANIGAFLMAVDRLGCRAGLHYNHSDDGALDIPLLLKRFNLEKRVELPQKFVSFREGIDDQSLNLVYNKYSTVVDCSSQSATGLTMLEAMATGCIPVGIDFGATGEIINQLPDGFRFFAPYEVLIGPREEEHAIVSPQGLTMALRCLRHQAEKPAWWAEAQGHCRRVAQNFSKDIFINRVNGIIENVVHTEHAIVVDSF